MSSKRNKEVVEKYYNASLALYTAIKRGQHGRNLDLGR